MSELITLIVPIYNVEQYLPRCIESIIAQTYSELEIILVDDGSPDQCGKICDDYALKDSRIKVIHKSNGGLSDARNAGLDNMTGAFVAFIDSDDWIDRDWCEKLVDNMHKFNADVSICGIISERFNTNSNQTNIITKEYGINPFYETGLDMMRRYFCSSWVAWDKIYRASIFNDIRFPVGEINEDEAIVLQILNKCNYVAFRNDTFYHYISRPESITTSSFSLKKLDWYRHCKANLEWIREHYPELEDLAAARYRGCLMWTLTEIALSDVSCPEEQRDMISELHNKRRFFLNISFDSAKEKIRFLMLSCIPFSIYRAFIRKKRKI